MLNEYILSNRACDIGMVYRWGNLHLMLQEMGQNSKGSFNAEFQKRKQMANQDLQKTIDFFASNA
jgi:hypothetical protein